MSDVEETKKPGKIKLPDGEHLGAVAPDDDQQLGYTQAVRRALIKKASEKIHDLDPKEMGILLKALDGHDKVTIAKQRMKHEEKENQLAKNALATFYAAIKESGNYDPLKVDPTTVADAPEGPQGYDPSQLPDFEDIRPENLKTGADPTDYNALMGKDK